MARNIVPIILTGDYIPDRGGTVSDLSYRAAQPADMADADFDALLGLVGARRKTAADSAPCSVGGSEFKPRKLIFTRQDGNTFSLVAPSHLNVVALAQSVKDAVTSNNVVCVALEGEEWTDLFPLLPGARIGAAVAGTPSRVTTGAKQAQHSGKINYQYDGGTGTTITQAVRVDTDLVDASGDTNAPTILGGEWTNCVGDFLPQNPCPSRQGLDPRHYVATLFTTNADNPYEQKKVPVADSANAEILNCGDALAALPSTVCLAYKGERNIRLHTLLT